MSAPNQQIRFRQRNRTYYADLERLHQLLVPPGQRVLEIGCGPADLLANLQPAHGVGIEANPELAQAARELHPGLRILAVDPETITPESIGESQPFDVILLPNTLNTLQDVQGLLERLEAFCHPRTRLVVSFHNWLWQPLLKAAESLGQRQPQPPESWLTPKDVRNLLDLAGWEVLKQGQRCLLPRQIPLITPLANRWLSQLPLIDNLGLTHWMVARPARQQRQNPSVSVVIPARNEAGNIAPAIERQPQLGRFTEVLFVEGHSSDNTWEEIERVCATYQGPLRLRKFRQSGKGKADAVWLGFDQAEGDVLMILDADLTVRPEDLPRFAQAMADGRGEFVNGCRLVYPRSWEAMPPLNTAANRFFAAAFSWLLRQRLKDTLCGTKVIWKEDYERLKAGRSYFGDFDPFGDFDLLFGASKLNLKIVEVPVRYQERSYGSSNIAHVKEGLILAQMCLYAARKLRFIP
ncbi:MAG: glycosyltransferase [Vulcanococcus sp.]